MSFMNYNQMRDWVKVTAGKHYSFRKLVKGIEQDDNRLAALLTCFFVFTAQVPGENPGLDKLAGRFFTEYDEELRELLPYPPKQEEMEKLVINDPERFIESTAQLINKKAITGYSLRGIVQVINSTCIIDLKESTMLQKLLYYLK